MKKALTTLITVLLSAVLFGVMFQAVISVLADTHAPSAALLIKSWKEMLLGLVAILLATYVWRYGSFREVFSDRIVQLVGAIGALHVILLLAFQNSYVGELAGLLIDVRMYLFFAEIYVFVKIWPPASTILIKTFLAGAGIVIAFSLLQVLVLPKDFLTVIGYSSATIQPYLTVDLNPDYVRISSTLRGPNPLGAFAVIIFSLLFAKLLSSKIRWRSVSKQQALIFVGIAATLVPLWFSYSRSALIAFFVSLAIFAGVWLTNRASLRTVVLLFVVMLTAGVGTIWLAQDTSFVQNVVLHSNPDGGSDHKSDDGHSESLTEGIEAVSTQPFGAGIGGTGSASLLTDQPKIIENQYLYFAHESGWIGLILQLGLYVFVLMRLWTLRNRSLSMGLFVSGVGVAVIGLVLPVWADDTVALVWWGLAGLALAGYNHKTGKAYARTNNKKTKRTT